MLRGRTCIARRGFDPRSIYVYGLPKRTFPLHEDYKHVLEADMPMRLFVTKHQISFPIQFPYQWDYWRTTVVVFLCTVIYDLCYGLPMAFAKESEPGKPHHFFFGNNGGIPHHFWEYQDGWHVPNMSGARRYVE